MNNELQKKLIDVSNEEYHKHEALGSSGLKQILINPREFRYKPATESKVFKNGTLGHTLILEPKHARKKYFVSDGKVSTKIKKMIEKGIDPKVYPQELLTKSGALSSSKNATLVLNALNKDEFLFPKEVDLYNEALINKDKVAFTFLEFDMIRKASKKAIKFLKRKGYYSKMITEKSVFINFEGLQLKARPDMMISVGENRVKIMDLKTTSGSASYRDFKKAMSSFDYWIQQAYYTFVLKQAGFIVVDFTFIVVSFQEWSGVEEFRLPTDLINAGEDRVMMGLEKYRHCMLENDWREGKFKNGKFEEITDISAPIYLYDKYVDFEG